MGAKSTIQWTDASWTPIRALVKHNAAEIAKEKGYASLIQIAAKMANHIGPHCEHCSPGCEHCYSETNNGRCLPANGTGLPFDRRSRDLIEPIMDRHILQQPLHWKKPRKVFVCSQTDLFGEWVPDEMIYQVFSIMAILPQHTFQVLTKRPERMLKWFTPDWGARRETWEGVRVAAAFHGRVQPEWDWPLSNVWLGVSAEDQQRADERIPLLLQTPAAVRFVSYEPALGPINLETFICRDYRDGTPQEVPGLDLVIVGGESGPRARPFDIHWARNTVEQCKDAGVACFVKQLGAKPMYRSHGDNKPQHLFNGLQDLHCNGELLKDSHGGDMAEWPQDLRIRQIPGDKV